MQKAELCHDSSPQSPKFIYVSPSVSSSLFFFPTLGSKEIFSLEHQKCSLPRVTSGHTKGKTENLCHYYMECFQCSEKKEENWHELASLDNNNEV